MRSSYGKIDVVAPSSAPMFVIVPLPVHDSERVPGPEVLDDAVRAALDGEDARTP